MQQTTTPPMRTFVYGDIPPDNAFRYLLLHPGGIDDPLKCSLLTSYLDNAPPYEAISYVWGTDTRDQHITCNGRSLYITQNLSKALRRFRSPNALVTLWADSICINQDDLEEKGRQVAIMSQIYQHAACVLIYMGEDPACHGPRVKSLLEDVIRMLDGEIAKLPPLSWNTFPRSSGTTAFVYDVRWKSVSTLMSQNWFTRGWVVREAALAQYGVVIWGQSLFSWANLMRVLQWLHMRAHEITAEHGDMHYRALSHLDAYVDRHVLAAPYLSVEHGWHPNSLLDYLAAGRKLHMKDPRDRLYAFLDIATGEERQIVVNPRYGDTALQIYHEFAIRHIQTIRQPRILDYVVHSTQSLYSGIPTWVPSWDYQENGPWREEGFIALTSRTDTVHEPIIANRGSMMVHAVILGSVLYTSSTLNGPSVTFETLANIWAAVQSRNQLMPPENSNPLRMLLSTFTQGGESGDPRTFDDLVTKYIERLRLACSHPNSDRHIGADIDFSQVLKWIQLSANAKKFMLLERGYMGLGPAVTQEGDVYAIVFGCTTSCILRPTSKQNYYKFIGPCHISGGRSVESWDGNPKYAYSLGYEYSKEWVNWDVEEQYIFLC